MALRLHRSVLTLALLCSLPWSLAAQHPNPGVPDRMTPADRSLLRVAIEAYDRGDTARAEPVLRSLSQRYAASYEINEALGSLYAEANQLDRALPYLQRSCKIAPHEALAHANLGAVYVKLNRPADAVVELRRATSLDPQNAQTQSSLGQALMLQKQPLQAAIAFAAASQATPGDPELKYNLALALYEGGAPRKAAQALDTIAAASMTAEMHALAGDAEERAGDFVQALAHFEAAARLDATDANLYALVVELLRHWNWDEAIKVADFASTRYPTSRHFSMASGIAYYGKSDYSPAVRIFSGLLQQDPSDSTVADLLGRSCMELSDGRDTGCAGVFAYAQSHPGNAIMMTYAAVALLHATQGEQKLDDAAKLLRAAIAADPRYAEAYLRLGVVEQMQAHWAESAALLEQSLVFNPKSPEAHYRLSRAYFRVGRKVEGDQQIALREQFAKDAKQALDARMQDVMRFIVVSK